MRSMSRRNKYNNHRTKDGDSDFEKNRFYQLQMMESAGEISDLKRSVPFVLIPSQYIDGKCVEYPCKYIADFTYYQDGEFVVEDAKGFVTDVYKIKRKLMLYLHGIRIKEYRRDKGCGRSKNTQKK